MSRSMNYAYDVADRNLLKLIKEGEKPPSPAKRISALSTSKLLNARVRCQRRKTHPARVTTFQDVSFTCLTTKRC